jgi:hypothetical protein
MVKAVRGVVAAGRSGANLVRHAANLRGYLMHLTPSDLRGAVKELRGLSSGAEHLQEVREAAGGLRALTKTLTNAMANSDLSQVERKLYERMLGAASKALDEAERALKSGQSP